MQRISKKRIQKVRRAKRVRAAVRGSQDEPRLSVFRSNRHLAAQLIDDEHRVTLASVSDRDVAPAKAGATRMTPRERAENLGERIAERAKEKNINAARFDRGSHRYHGIVAAFAAGARKGGLKF